MIAYKRPPNNNILLLVTLLTIIIIFTFEAKAEKLSILFGGWSNHNMILKEGQKNNYNQNHKMVGIKYKNIIVSAFTNSHYDKSTVIAYDWHLYSKEYKRLTLDINVATGLVSGYDSYNIVDNISPYLLPTINLSYSLNNNYSITLNNGLLPDERGVILTTSLSVNYSF